MRSLVSFYYLVYGFRAKRGNHTQKIGSTLLAFVLSLSRGRLDSLQTCAMV
jgi:hypothetical protein